jgi:hypothetical protein
LERLAAAYRRPPASAGAAAAPFDAAEFLALLANQAASGPEVPPAPFEDVGGDEDAEEIRRQAAEALWLSLLYDARA